MDDREVSLQRLQRDLDILLPRGNSQATITVQAGGLGIWLAATFAAVMLAMNILLAWQLFDLQRKYDRMQDHLSAIYMQAPYLKGTK